MTKIVDKIFNEEITSIKSTRLNDKYNDIAKDFMEPCLSECKYLRRDTGWFQSSSLKAWVGALEHLIEKESNDIKLEYLCSPGTDLRTIQAIKASKSPQKKEEILRESKNKLILDTVLLSAANNINQVGSANKTIGQVLAHLIVTGKLEIRFAEVQDFENLILITDEMVDPELYHPKMGYFAFSDGSEISFNGSMNESYGGLKKQGEYVDIFCSKRSWEIKKIREHYDTLNDAWNGLEGGTRIIKTSDTTIDELNRFLKKNPITKRKTGTNTPTPIPESTMAPVKNKLRDYQKEAIDQWFKNDGRGLFEHATGSGKTFTAINIIKKMYEKNNTFTVIGVPYRPLGGQWHHELKKFFGERKIDISIIECWSKSKNTDWPGDCWQQLNELRRTIRDGGKKLLVMIVVNKSLSKFAALYQKGSFDINKCLFIGDECHNYRSEGFIPNAPDAKYRLGLSATPVNNDNEPTEGEVRMLEYFGGERHIFTLDQAIPKYLCEYEYFPHECYLSEEEFEEWKENYVKTGWVGDQDEDSNTGALFGKMTRILGGMEDKFRVLKKILPTDISKRKHTLFFASDSKDLDGKRHIEKVADVLLEKGWQPSRITNEEDDQERIRIIKNFVDGRTDGLLAIKVLDEGIDIPEIRTAYILASTTSKRQFIQRRGRVLRKLDGILKTAVIHDFIAVPPETVTNAGKKILANEISRVKQMSSKALNKKSLQKFLNRYKNYT